jgi:hypothetical protein
MWSSEDLSNVAPSTSGVVNTLSCSCMSDNWDDGWVMALVRVVTVVGNGCTTAAGDRVDKALVVADFGLGDDGTDAVAAAVATEATTVASWAAAMAGVDMVKGNAAGWVHQKSRGSAAGTAADTVPLAARKRAIMVPIVDGGTAGAEITDGVVGAVADTMVAVGTSIDASLDWEAVTSVVVVKCGRTL